MEHSQPSQGSEQLSNSPTPTPPTVQQSPSPTGRKNALQLQVSSSSSGAPPSKQDAKADSKFTSRPASPLFAVTLAHTSDDHDEEQQELLHFATSSLVSPGPSARTFSPSPLLWSHGGWHAGHFSFDGGADNGSEVEDAAERDDAEQGVWAGKADKGREGASVESTSASGSEEGHGSNSGLEESTTATSVKEEQATPRIKSATIPVSKTLRSNLTPTAAPFVFKPKSTSLPTAITAPVSTHPRLTPLVTSLPAPSSTVPSHGTPSPTTDFDYLDSAQAEDLYIGEQYDYTRREEESEWQLDEHGNLVNLGGEGKYTIAEDILQLQSAQPAPSTTTTMGYGGRVHTKMPGSSSATASYLDQGRRASESSLASSSWCPPRPQISFPTSSSIYFPATPPLSHPNSPERSRASSISSQHSYFSPRAPSTVDRSPTAAQLQLYFGPSPVDVNSPYTHAFDAAAGSLPPSPSALRDIPAYGSSSSSTVSSIAYQTDPEDILYTEARETFIQHSFATLSSTPTAANRQSMTAHFDRAMHSPFPLATLYGLTPEAATQLAADPARSGVADNVLKLALIRGQQQRLAGAAGLGGPSANNRKLGLYKTELCRSWEEKGSCRYGAKCQFAHGQHEVREVARHPKFKSEVCRTFWLHGSCPYGRRCCFIHTTVPGGAATPSGPASESLAPSSTALTSSTPVASSEPTSRIGQRMSSTSSAAVAAAVQASTRGFGPALANYLGPTSTPPSLSPASSYQNSPVEKLRHDFGISGNGGNGNGGKTALAGSPFDSSTPLIGFGLKPPGRFTTNPSEVPPTFQDPPKSRLERLTSLPNPATPRSAQASFDLGSPLFGAGRGAFSNGGGLNCTFASTSAAPASPSPHTRNSSNSSFSSVATSSSTSSLGLPRMSSSSYSPFLPRTDSNSSLSSLGGGSTYSTFAPLQPVGGDWVSSTASNCKGKSGVLDWDTTGLEDEEDLTFAETSQEYVPAGGSTGSASGSGSGSTSTDYHHQYGMMEGLGSLSLSIDRSAEMTPLGVK